jgi:Rrf2 family nitric oxide-sensitive transcriptional repressor
MRLAEYTDYALRVLMYCAAHPYRLVTIAELAERNAVSKNHLMKIVNDLARQGLLRTTRGRGGGVALLRKPSDIRVGEVVRTAETDMRMVECFDARTNTCALTPTCRLKRVFDVALRAYLSELDKATLADIVSIPGGGASVSGAPRRPAVAAVNVVPVAGPRTPPVNARLDTARAASPVRRRSSARR